jgi:hypothetical protein
MNKSGSKGTEMMKSLEISLQSHGVWWERYVMLEIFNIKGKPIIDI